VRSKIIASRYAKALFSLLAKDKLGEFSQDVESLIGFFQNNPQLAKSLNSSVFSLQKKESFVQELAGQLSQTKIWQNFLWLLVKKHRFDFVVEILQELKAIILDYQNGEKVQLVLAREHSQELLKEIEKAIEKKIGKEPKVSLLVDKSIVGGFVAHTKNFTIDCSVKSSLDRLAAQ